MSIYRERTTSHRRPAPRRGDTLRERREGRFSEMRSRPTRRPYRVSRAESPYRRRVAPRGINQYEERDLYERPVPRVRRVRRSESPVRAGSVRTQRNRTAQPQSAQAQGYQKRRLQRAMQEKEQSTLKNVARFALSEAVTVTDAKGTQHLLEKGDVLTVASKNPVTKES